MKSRVVIGVFVAAAGVLLFSASAGAGGTDVVTCGSIIKKSGMYRLVKDCTGGGIVIQASDVTLDLRGHTMTGDGTDFGIHAAEVGNVQIIGPGVIKKYYEGILLGPVGGIKVGNVTTTKSTASGVDVGESEDVSFDGTVSKNNGYAGFYNYANGGNRFRNVSATGNADGIDVINSFQAQISGGVFSGNGNDGIFVDNGSQNNTIGNNTALGNGNYDLYDQNASCDNNTWSGNTFGSANQGCIS